MMKIPSLAETRQYVGHLGYRRAFWRAAYVAANQVMEVSIMGCVLVRPGTLDPSFAAPSPVYTGRFLEPEEAAVLSKGFELAGQEALRSAIDRGDACYGVLKGDRLANVALFTPHPTPLMGDLVVHFEPPSWYMYGGYTPKEFRGDHLHSRSFVGGCFELFDRGVPSVVSLIERTNYRSWASVDRMGGGEPAGSIYRLKLGPFSYLGRTSRARKFGMRLEAIEPEKSA